MAVGAFLGISLIWGSTWLMIKIGLAGVPPFTFAAGRFLVAGVMLGAIVVARRARLPTTRAEWLVVVGTGILGVGAGYALVYWSEQFIGSGIACVIQSTSPLFGVVFAHLFLKDDRLSPRKVLGAVLGLGGVLLIYSGQLSAGGRMAGFGTLAMLGSAVVSALSAVAVGRWARRIDPLVLTAGQIITAAIPLAVLALVQEGGTVLAPWPATSLWTALYLAAVGTVAALFLYNWLLQRIPVTRVQLQVFLSTVLAVLLGVAVLGEKFEWQTALGSLVAVLAVVISVGVRWPRRAGTAAQSAASEDQGP